ncbi:MAG: cobalamin-dependent protein [Bacillota bacterium]
MKELYAGIRQAFWEYEPEAALHGLQQALKQEEEPTALVQFLSEQLTEIGEQFSRGELFLPDMMMAGDVMESCMGLLRPLLESKGAGNASLGKVLLGTVKGDIHDIGKNMVKTMLSASGFQVIDLGTDVSTEQFFNAAMQEKPDIIALSSCMTTTIPSMQDTLDMFTDRDLHKSFKIVVGGGSMNQELVERLGHCIYGGRDAFEAARTCRNLMENDQIGGMRQ